MVKRFVPGEVERELLHPTQFNLNINDPGSSDTSDTEGPRTNSPTIETARLPDQIVDNLSDSPQDCSLVASSTHQKQSVEHRITAVAA